MENQGGQWIVASLAHRSGPRPQAPETARALLSIWTDTASALESIIGPNGVCALYDRSLSLTAKAHPWLANARTGAANAVDLEALQTAVSQQTAPAAVAGAAFLLQNFYDVLVSLIGSTLCDQLLQSVRESPGQWPTREP